MWLPVLAIAVVLAISHGGVFLFAYARGYDRCHERWKLIRAAERSTATPISRHPRPIPPDEAAQSPVHNKAIQATIDEVKRQ